MSIYGVQAVYGNHTWKERFYFIGVVLIFLWKDLSKFMSHSVQDSHWTSTFLVPAITTIIMLF